MGEKPKPPRSLLANLLSDMKGAVAQAAPYWETEDQIPDRKTAAKKGGRPILAPLDGEQFQAARGKMQRQICADLCGFSVKVLDKIERNISVSADSRKKALKFMKDKRKDPSKNYQ